MYSTYQFFLHRWPITIAEIFSFISDILHIKGLSSTISMLLAQKSSDHDILASEQLVWIGLHTLQRETFEGENLHEFCDFTAIHESFLHEILGMPHPFMRLI